jgi:gamma-glutamylcyclotransferase
MHPPTGGGERSAGSKHTGRVLYFAYGSNMDPQRMGARDVRPQSRRHAILDGFTLLFNKSTIKNDREGKANIAPVPGGRVEGVLYAVTEEEMESLDRKEGVRSGDYLRAVLSVGLDDGSRVDAIAYVAHSSKVRPGLKPTREYLGHLLAAADLLSHEYVERLKATVTLD